LEAVFTFYAIVPSFMETIICYVGGSARGNPGPSAYGVYITDAKGNLLSEVGKGIGNGTDNFAAYYGVMVGLQTLQGMLGAKSMGTEIDLRLDNEVVKKQLNAESPINEPGLVPMFIEIYNMRVASFPYITLTLISRDENKEVDRLVTDALDGKEK